MDKVLCTYSKIIKKCFINYDYLHESSVYSIFAQKYEVRLSVYILETTEKFATSFPIYLTEPLTSKVFGEIWPYRV